MGNLIVFKQNERVVKCSEVKGGEVEMGSNRVSISVGRWSKGLCNRMYNITG